MHLQPYGITQQQNMIKNMRTRVQAHSTPGKFMKKPKCSKEDTN